MVMRMVYSCIIFIFYVTIKNGILIRTGYQLSKWILCLLYIGLLIQLINYSPFVLHFIFYLDGMNMIEV